MTGSRSAILSSASGRASHLEVAVASDKDTHNRVVGVWGPDAYTWSGEERQRAAGFPIDPSGRQRVLGFPPGPPVKINCGWLRSIAHPVRSFKRRGAEAGQHRG
jgi:hypothetical protein